MIDVKKNLDQVSLYARLDAAVVIEEEFDRLFKVLDLVPSELSPTIERRDVINIIETYKNMEIFKGAKDGICDKKGEPV